GQGAVIWSDLVRQRTNGRINIKVYPGTSLVQGDQTREFTAIRQGVIDMAIGSTINWSPQVKQLNLFSLPFLMPDYPAIDALTHGKVGQDLFKILTQKGVVPLAWGENGYRQLSNSVREVKTPADIKGMKLRVVGSPLYIDTFTALGANPTQMSWADAQPALASGAVDGQENPLSIYYGAKLYDVGQKYLTLWNYVADPLIFVVNKDVWNSWTPEDQKIVREAAIEAGQKEIVIARKGVTSTDDSLLKEIESHGVKVTTLSPEQIAAFAKVTQPVFDKWAKQIGPDLVKQAQADIAKR
ncbi:MAG TPA: DctP family TRAP transporter solute-binding subunit, partial [Castellaniella sp.]|uniref:DctP family TRAP transporter solute-binding subunit n=1 Tax=Castellaniella sp. TaxID=1955812 RepID=UPI002F1BBFCB